MNNPFFDLVAAISRHDLEWMERLLDQGVDPNAFNGSGLMPLAILGHNTPHATSRAGMELLLHHGAKIDMLDRRGRTALATAARTGHVENVQALVELGADPWIRDPEGMSALAWAVDGVNIECAELLVRRFGWDEAFRSKQGEPLDQWMLSRFAGAKVKQMMTQLEVARVEHHAAQLDQATAEHTRSIGRPRL